MNTSSRLYERARELMPWGTQTNAKRPLDALADDMPLFFERADGCRLQTPEGAWYIDYRSALGPNILGYRQADVEAAVQAQMEKGVLFSMASPVEVEVAERMVALVPGLEQVRFMKTGNDANSASVRIARAFTGRDHLVTCGYHGYGDWFSCGTGAAPALFESDFTGVPAVLDTLVTRVAYGDVAALNEVFAQRGDEIAGLIMVPYDWGENVATAFVERARALTEKHGSLLIFDQVLTGFRLALGGAQEHFGVVPDLSSYAKALANGYPLSAFGGRRDVMETLYRVTITTTYAGETLSLAAAAATLDVMQREPVIEHVWAMGERLRQGFDAAAARLGLDAHAYGLPPAVQLRFSQNAEQEERAHVVFARELYRRGIFASRPFLLSYAHQPADIDETTEAMAQALAVVAHEVFASTPSTAP
jgi:glutamate-1-semialdehyde aminotransferase